MSLKFEIPYQDYSRTIATTMKDECPYILDWVSYHLAIGFTHFIILTNDCSDGTEKLCRNLERLGVATQKNNPAPHPRGPQKNGYLRMRRLEAFQKAIWLLALDVDEYLRIDIGDGSLDALFRAAGNVSAISFVWQLFGNDGVEKILDRPVMEQFTRSGHELQARPYEALPIKTLYRGEYFARIGTHRPHDPNPKLESVLKWIDADGILLPFHKARHWRSYEGGLGFGTALGRVNHYALRSLDGFLVKWARGFVHANAPTVRGKGSPVDYWRLFNWNDREERRITRHMETANAIKTQILSDKKINRLHQNGLEWHQNRAKELLKTHSYLADAASEIRSMKERGELPDFSKHGSPTVGKAEIVSPENLISKINSHSILDPKLLEEVIQLYQSALENEQ